MFKITSSVTSIGLEHIASGLKIAVIESRLKGVLIKKLLKLNPETDNVKPLYMHHPILVTGLDGQEILVRPLYFPLTKEKDLAAALSFQAEPILPYPVDEALLAYQILEKIQDGTTVSLLSTKKDSLFHHLEKWKSLKIDPEKVSCIPWALLLFGSHFFPSHHTFLLLHIQSHEMTCILIKEKKLLASFAIPASLQLIFKLQSELKTSEQLPKNEKEWDLYLADKESPLAQEIVQVQRNIIKMGFALAKELRGNESIEGIAITGETASFDGLNEILVRPLKFPLLQCEPPAEYQSKELCEFAVPIGLGIAGLPGQAAQVDFLQEEFAYARPWRRLKVPMAAYIISVLLLSASFYFFTKHYIAYQEDLLKKEYIEMLASTNKSYNEFEEAYQAKNPHLREMYQGEIPSINLLSTDEIQDRLANLQTELQAIPDNFPLFPIPLE